MERIKMLVNLVSDQLQRGRGVRVMLISMD